MKQRAFSVGRYKRQLLLLGIVGVGLYVIVPQLSGFRDSWHLLERPELAWLIVAAGLVALTYFAAAATYFWLALKPLRYREVLLVQLAAMFINRLLPGGVGAIGANYTYLRHRQHSAAQAACVTAVNNLWGFLGHGLVVAATLLFFSVRHLPVGVSAPRDAWIQPWTVLLVIGVVLLVLSSAILQRQRASRVLKDITRQLLSYRQHTGRLGLGLVSSISLTLSNVLALMACASALHLTMSFAAMVLVFTFGVGIGTATPTPGGLGGFEAGIAAGLIAYHVTGSTALAVALLYRVLSYWLPLVAGGVAFVICQRRQLFG